MLGKEVQSMLGKEVQSMLQFSKSALSYLACWQNEIWFT